jgi:hypothetical protein
MKVYQMPIIINMISRSSYTNGLANKSKDGNFYEKSRVEFRLNELKREAELLIN